MEKSLHEQVAFEMAALPSPSLLNKTYDEILTKLHERCPTEEDLRAYVGAMEQEAKNDGAVKPDFDFFKLMEKRRVRFN